MKNIEQSGMVWRMSFGFGRAEYIHVTYASLTEPSHVTYTFEFVLEWNEIWMFVFFHFIFNFCNYLEKNNEITQNRMWSACNMCNQSIEICPSWETGRRETAAGSRCLRRRTIKMRYVCEFVIWSISRLTSRFFSYYTFRTRKNSKQQPRISQSAEHSGIT